MDAFGGVWSRLKLWRPGRVSSRVRAEIALVVLLAIGSGIWGTMFWKRWIAAGNVPSFYQLYFEPAVMIACGKGFAVSRPEQPPSLADFLWMRRDSFDCRDIPPTLIVDQRGLYQGAWRYLMFAVGWAWKVLGISWSGMGPLFGLMFGVVIVFAYGIFRLGMGPVAAVLCTVPLMASAMHLNNLPHLRDYAKAPFTLALIFMLGLIVTLPVRRWRVLLLSVVYGVVLGIGYGFRTDFLINVPVFFLVLFGFLEGGVLKHIGLKTAASALALGSFLLVGWPILSTVQKQGGCQWHVVLLGLQAPLDEPLGIAPAPYYVGPHYADMYIDRTVTAYASRTAPETVPFPYCSHQYDVQSGRYLMELAAMFPADIAARAYASILQIVDMPFIWASPPVGWTDDFYINLQTLRRTMLRALQGWGPIFVGATVILVGSSSVRVGLFILFFVLFFCGYPAIQFQERHYFHLEFIAWWPIGFLAYHILGELWATWRQGPAIRWKAARPGLKRAAIVAAVGTVAVAAPLRLTRWYQTPRVTRLLQAYERAPKESLPVASLTPGVLNEVTLPDLLSGELLEVDLNRAACAGGPSVTFRYDEQEPSENFSRTVTFPPFVMGRGTTRVYLTVFRRFKGLEFSDPRPECVTGAFRIANPKSFPLLLNATLAPDWERGPLYQQIRGELAPVTYLTRFNHWYARVSRARN